MADANANGSWITLGENGAVAVPDNPIIGFIEGDGTGPDIWKASVKVFDAAVAKAYAGKRKVHWHELLAGEKAYRETGEWLPQRTIDDIRQCRVSIKGPLTTPVGGGMRSLNVTLRQVLDLYACIRPVRYIPGTPSPVKRPEDVDMVIFRENTEDVYAGIEWPAGSREAKRIIEMLHDEMGVNILPESGIGVKPMSRFGSSRLVRMAIRHAIERGRTSVTLVHKGNIMKFTEGAFKEWGYAVAEEEFGERTIPETDIAAKYDGQVPEGRIVVKDRIADSMFQQALLRPQEYSVLATPNLNGDYLSDALAAQVGGLGMAPGANVGDECAMFEATHGTAPKYADKDMVNPGSLILSGVMMFEHMGWMEAARTIRGALEKTVGDKVVTYDLARQMEGATEVGTSGFAQAMVERMEG